MTFCKKKTIGCGDDLDNLRLYKRINNILCVTLKIFISVNILIY